MRKGLTVRLAPAVPDDIAECVLLRGQTRENAVSVDRLRAVGVTVDSWSDDVRRGVLLGHVARVNGLSVAGDAQGQRTGDCDGSVAAAMAGYCFGDVTSGEVVVLALLPAFESQGLGKRLLRLVVDDLVARGHRRLFLGCSANPRHRSHGFYRHLGWRPTGNVDARGDEALEWFAPAHPSRSMQSE